MSKKRMDYWGRPVANTVESLKPEDYYIPGEAELDEATRERISSPTFARLRPQIRSPPPMTRLVPGLLPIGLPEGVAVAAGCSSRVSTCPQIPCKLQRLIVPKTFASYFLLQGITIGENQVFGAVGEVLCEVFWGDDERPEIPPIMLKRTVEPGQVVVLQVRNWSGMAMPFNAVFQTLICQ